MGSVVVEARSLSDGKQTSQFKAPPSNLTVAQLSEDLSTLSYIFHHPNVFLDHLIHGAFNDTSEKLNPHIRHLFSASFKDSIYFTGNFFFTKAREIAPYILCAFKTSKLALQLMLSDIFEAFISPLAEKGGGGLLPLNGTIAASMISVSLLTHKLAKKHLQEDPAQALSITYGAITGILASYTMDHDIFVGTLAGASVGLITDTAVSYVNSGVLTVFFKNLYKKLEIQEKAEAVQNFTSKVFPYISFTLGTALVYSRISPIVAKVMEEEEIPSKKMHVIKMVAASGMLFGMGKSYLLPLVKSLLVHIKIGAKSARDTGLIASWTPRILSI